MHRECASLLKCQRLPPVTHLHKIRSQLLVFPNRSTYWKPHIQIHKLMENILLQTITVVLIVLEASTKAVSHSKKSYNICT